MKMEDLKNKKFGMLTAREYLGKGKWKCECECGNFTEVFTENLKSMHTTSCGCKKGTGIIGKEFGRLKVVEKIGKENYLCECKCGQKEIRSYDSLMSGSKNQMCKKCGKKAREKALKESETFVDGTQIAKISINKKPGKANKSGVVGVNWDKSRGKWQASIRFKGYKYNLGRFDDIQDAIDARKEAEKNIFGNFLIWYENVYKKGKTDDK